jgi:hypothetical protein
MPVPEHDRPRSLGDLRYSEKVAKLGHALIAISRDLAACRRQVAMLERENGELRERTTRAR